MQEILSQIQLREATYQAEDRIQQQMRKHTAVTLLGLLSIQRVVHAIPELDDEFATARQFTTRQPRVRESPAAYRFRSGAPKGLKRILDEVRGGKLTGFHVDTANVVYGSALDDIEDTPFTLLSVPRTPAARKQFVNAAWGKQLEYMIVPEQGEYMQQMRRQLHGASENSKQSRIRENNGKLSWALAQTEALIWVPYDHTDPSATTEHIVAIAQGQAEPDPIYRELGLELAESLKIA